MSLIKIFFLLILSMLISSIIFNNQRFTSKHLTKPQVVDEMPDDLKQNIDKIVTSDYGKKILSMSDQIKGKKVASTISGNSGYILKFEDESYIVCYIDSNIKKLLPLLKNGEVTKNDIDLINLTLFGDTSSGLDYDFPYADDYNDKDKELKNTIGQFIEGVAIGENTFNIAFPNGLELDAMIVVDEAGKESLRIFWEQW